MTFGGRPVRLSDGLSSLKSDQRHPEGLPAFQPEPARGRGQRADQHCRRPLLLQRRRPAGTAGSLRARSACEGQGHPPTSARAVASSVAEPRRCARLCQAWAPGRALRGGLAAPGGGQRTACTPARSSFRLDLLPVVRKPQKASSLPSPPFPFSRGSADPASPMPSRVNFTWLEPFWPSGGRTSQCPSCKPPGSGNVSCEGPETKYFSKISSNLLPQKVASRCLQTVYFL